MEIVLCNNNWTAVSFHLDTTSGFPLAGTREDEKEEEGSPRKGRRGADNRCGSDGNDSATTSGCGREILQRAAPRLADPRLCISLFPPYIVNG